LTNNRTAHIQPLLELNTLYRFST